MITSSLEEFFRSKSAKAWEKVMLQAEAATPVSKSPLLSQVSGVSLCGACYKIIIISAIIVV